IAYVDGVPVEQARSQVYALMPAGSYFKPHYWDQLHALFVQYVGAHPLLAVQVWLVNVGKTMFGLFVTQLKIMLNPTLLETPGVLSIATAQGPIWSKIVAYIVRGSMQTWVVVLGCIETLWTIARFGLALTGLWKLIERRAYRTFMLALIYLGYFLMVTGHD